MPIKSDIKNTIGFKSNSFDKIAGVYNKDVYSIMGINSPTPLPLDSVIISQTPVVFRSDNCSSTSIAMLTPDKAIAAYEYDEDRDRLAGCVLSLSDTTIVPGASTISSEQYTSFQSVDRLEYNKAIVVYRNGDLEGNVCIYSVSNMSVTIGPLSTFSTANIDSCKVVSLSSAKAIVVYWNDDVDDRGEACVLNVDGDTVVPGSAQVFNNSRSWYAGISRLSSNKFIVTYGDSTTYGRARIGTVSGNSISWGPVATFENARTSWTSVCKLSDSKALVAYCDRGNSDKGTACVLDISGTSITPGTPVVFEAGSIEFTSVTALDEETAIVVYKDISAGSYGTSCVLKVSGDTVTPGSAHVFESASTGYECITTMERTKAIVIYDDNGNNGYGTCCLLEIPTV